MSFESPRPWRVERLGRVPYGPTHLLQKQRHAEVAAGALDTLFVLEHEAVITLGRNSGDTHVLANRELLMARGIDVVETERGGDVTYHGPGQLVVYPVIRLHGREQDIKRYVWCLEEIMIRTVAAYGVQAERVEGLRGLWVGKDKIGAVGVRLALWTTFHGFALNVHTDLEDFRLIVPCGLHGRGVTSLARLLGDDAPSLVEVEQTVIKHAEEILHRQCVSRADAVDGSTERPDTAPTVEVASL